MYLLLSFNRNCYIASYTALNLGKRIDNAQGALESSAGRRCDRNGVGIWSMTAMLAWRIAHTDGDISNGADVNGGSCCLTGSIYSQPSADGMGYSYWREAFSWD